MGLFGHFSGGSFLFSCYHNVHTLREFSVVLVCFLGLPCLKVNQSKLSGVIVWKYYLLLRFQTSSVCL